MDRGGMYEKRGRLRGEGEEIMDSRKPLKVCTNFFFFFFLLKNLTFNFKPDFSCPLSTVKSVR